LYVERKQLVAPGEILAEGKHLSGENTHRDGERIYSSRVGVVEIVGDRLSVIPLKGRYIPHVGDIVVGRIVDIGMSGWIVDINAPYPALLPASETFGHRGPRGRMDLSRIVRCG